MDSERGSWFYACYYSLLRIPLVFQVLCFRGIIYCPHAVIVSEAIGGFSKKGRALDCDF